jgi:predicted CoA-substrate-specific enzyme activase
LLHSTYRRHYGRPAEITQQVLCEELAVQPAVEGMAFTGSGGKLVAEVLGVPFDNEIICQARGVGTLLPAVRSLIAVGGEDSYLILLEEGGAGGATPIRDFAMNGLCAAGCGSFLDQQASRLGVEIEHEFGALAVASATPARVAGRCSVFAKTDMIHLQQQATPVGDIVAGLCFAFARNFISTLARGKALTPPMAFCGGVALNAGMVRAFRETLGLTPAQFIVPPFAAVSGAIGAALLARASAHRTTPLSLAALVDYLGSVRQGREAHPPLPNPGPPPGSVVMPVESDTPVDAYLGVDIGSISTNVVLIDARKRVLAKCYLMTAGRPIEAVRHGLAEVGELLADRVVVRGVCTTGSGRYLSGDFIGADVVKNEITAQARAAAEIDPLVDTIFEIGGQDSKYIRLEQGAIVDFEMNKVCAAGTGSFLEEQAERLGISIKGEFAQLALASPAPVCLGERCTVFMESDLVGQQSRGAGTGDLAAGLAYSIVQNYLNRVVADRRVGERIFFQGGTAFNRAVVAAFGQVTGKTITVPEHHEVTGALGCALIAMEHARPGVPSKFRGWDLSTRAYQQDSFECQGCANRCTINRVRMAGEETLHYGGRCEKFEKRRFDMSGIPDLFAERNAMLLAGYQEPTPQPGKPLIGIPRTLHFSEYAPFWLAFFNALALPVRLSEATNKQMVQQGLEAVTAEFCFPVKVAHGHVAALMDAGVTHLFLPNVQQLPKPQAGYKESVPCPFVQSLPYTIRAAMAPEARGVSVLAPVVELHGPPQRTIQALYQALKQFAVSRDLVALALEYGFVAQRAFGAKLARRGSEILSALPADGRAVVIVSRPYNGCDNAVSMELPTRFRELGVLPIPMDMLPIDAVDLSEEFPDLTWRYGQKILAAAEIIRADRRLHAVYLSNFGCGPDSFLQRFFRTRMGKKTYLQIEVDEHSSDVGMITRCEAFLDSLPTGERAVSAGHAFRPNVVTASRQRTIYIPNMCDLAHALAGAFRSVGQPAEVLPKSDAESAATGKRFCSGKECFPCIVTTGDFVRFLQQPDVNPAQVAFFMPSAGGGCRFGYYNILQRQILDDLGFTDVPIFSPNQNRGFYGALGAKAGETFVRRAWQGIVAIELLEKALHHVRPHEATAGMAQVVYQAQLRLVTSALEAGADLEPLMRAARAAFAAIPCGVDARPWVGVLGEVFVRQHEYSNQGLVRHIEALGGKVWLAPFTEWIYYVNDLQREDRRRDRQWGDLLRVHLVDAVMRHDEHRLARVWEGFIPHLHETAPRELVANGQRYIDPAFRGEAVLGLGKAMDFHRRGLAGIINVMPFTCMPGIITSSVFKRFQQEHDNMPVLNLSFEGLDSGDLPIRLEAFLQQCGSYQTRRVKSKE